MAVVRTLAKMLLSLPFVALVALVFGIGRRGSFVKGVLTEWPIFSRASWDVGDSRDDKSTVCNWVHCRRRGSEKGF